MGEINERVAKWREQDSKRCIRKRPPLWAQSCTLPQVQRSRSQHRALNVILGCKHDALCNSLPIFSSKTMNIPNWGLNWDQISDLMYIIAINIFYNAYLHPLLCCLMFLTSAVTLQGWKTKLSIYFQSCLYCWWVWDDKLKCNWIWTLLVGFLLQCPRLPWWDSICHRDEAT